MKSQVSEGVIGMVCVLLIVTPCLVSAYAPSDVRCTIEFSESQIKFTKFGEYDVIRMTDVGVISDLGKPVLPAKDVRIALPSGMRATHIEVHAANTITIPGTFYVMPGQPPRPMLQNYVPQSVEPDYDTYHAKAAYPRRLATLEQQANLAGQQIAMISVYPLQYEPAKKKLILHTRIELTVHCAPMATADNPFVEQYHIFTERQRRLYQDMLATMVINPEAVHINPYTGGSSTLVPPGQYEHVIVTTTTLKPYFQPIVDWHMKKGIRDTIITTDWIYANYSGSADTVKIREFVSDANASWGTMYFLMGGEGSDVPYGERHYYGEYPDQVAPSVQFYSDFDDDWVHEVYVGRVSATTQSEIAIFVDKLMKYEKDPPLTNYPTEALLTGFDLDDSTPAELLKDSIETFLPGYFTAHKVYDSHGGNHEDSVKYYLNMGNNLVNHMDHSGKTAMGIGYHHHGWILGNSEVDSLSNDDELSVITTGGCEPAAFDYDDCIGEHFVIYNDLQAAVAFIGNSRHGWYYGGDPYSLSNEVDLWFWYGLFTQGKDDLGRALIYAKHQFATPNDWDKACEWNVNLLGDPAMPIWTDAPAVLLVSHDSLVAENATDFSVSVTEDDSITPVESVLVCCYIPSQAPPMYVTDYTDASGTAMLDISPTTPDDTMYVTVTKYNYLPYEGYALVVDPIPAAPHIVQVQKQGSDARLIWNLVTTDASGIPLTMDYYVIYRNTSPDFIPSVSDSIGATAHPETTYADGDAVNGSNSYYYLVKAVSATARKSEKSNMGYVFHKVVNANTAATDRNRALVPRGFYTTVDDVIDEYNRGALPLK